MSFGAVAVDHVGPTLRWPGRSMLTGLIGNALGWDWTDREAHAALQGRMVCAAASLRDGEIITDVQNARLGKGDKGWTTRGAAEGRAGDSYDSPHRRRREFLADGELVVVLTLEPTESAPSLETIRAALARPARPLFLGRKPCLPAAPLVEDAAPFVEAADAHGALRAAVGSTDVRAWWPDGEGPDGTRVLDVADLRNWDSGLHGGSRRVREGRL